MMAEDEELRLPLTCPISRRRIVTPCRSDICSHLRCFDAQSFLERAKSLECWICPICYIAITFSSLHIDGLFAEVLGFGTLPPSCEEISVARDGSWEPVVKSNVSLEKVPRSPCVVAHPGPSLSTFHRVKSFCNWREPSVEQVSSPMKMPCTADDSFFPSPNTSSRSPMSSLTNTKGASKRIKPYYINNNNSNAPVHLNPASFTVNQGSNLTLEGTTAGASCLQATNADFVTAMSNFFKQEIPSGASGTSATNTMYRSAISETMETSAVGGGGSSTNKRQIISPNICSSNVFTSTPFNYRVGQGVMTKPSAVFTGEIKEIEDHESPQEFLNILEDEFADTPIAPDALLQTSCDNQLENLTFVIPSEVTNTEMTSKTSEADPTTTASGQPLKMSLLIQIDINQSTNASRSSSQVSNKEMSSAATPLSSSLSLHVDSCDTSVGPHISKPVTDETFNMTYSTQSDLSAPNLSSVVCVGPNGLSTLVTPSSMANSQETNKILSPSGEAETNNDATLMQQDDKTAFQKVLRELKEKFAAHKEIAAEQEVNTAEDQVSLMETQGAASQLLMMQTSEESAEGQRSMENNEPPGPPPKISSPKHTCKRKIQPDPVVTPLRRITRSQTRALAAAGGNTTTKAPPESTKSSRAKPPKTKAAAKKQ